MKVLIIEDERQNVEAVTHALHSIDSTIEIVESLPSIKDSVAWLRSNPEPDLIVSDVRLEDGDSFEIFRRVHVEAPVAYLTAYDEYASEAFRLHGVRYLTKPIDLAELRELVVYVRNKINPPKPRVRLMVPCDGETRMIPVSEVSCLISEAGGTAIVKVDGDKVCTAMPVGKLEEQLEGNDFVRVSRRAVVSLSKITSLLRADKDLMAVRVAGWADPIAVSRSRTVFIRRILEG